MRTEIEGPESETSGGFGSLGSTQRRASTIIEMFKTAIDSDASWFDTLSFLNWYVTNFKPHNYLEIGVRRGRSMAQVLTQSPLINVGRFLTCRFFNSEITKLGPGFGVPLYS